MKRCLTELSLENLHLHQDIDQLQQQNQACPQQYIESNHLEQNRFQCDIVNEQLRLRDEYDQLQAERMRLEILKQVTSKALQRRDGDYNRM